MKISEPTTSHLLLYPGLSQWKLLATPYYYSSMVITDSWFNALHFVDMFISWWKGSVRFRKDSVEHRLQDSPEMIKEKVFHLSKIFTLSQRTVVIFDSEFESSSFSASSMPTTLHQQMVNMEKEGLIQSVVSLDQCSLPRKLAFPRFLLEKTGNDDNSLALK